MIFVFKTSVGSKEQANALKPYMDQLLPRAKWNFDLDDCDNVLRIDSDVDVIAPVIQLLHKHQFHCEELE